MKRILATRTRPGRHWVGDGFPVRTLLSHHDLGPDVSPFLMLDHAGPLEFGPASQPRGVGEHPHRGFETVTIVYEGEVEHRDSAGNGGVIGPGDVQWMTAGSGVVHQEFHSHAFTKAGGRLEMAQLWINLPARDKMTAPGYQAILSRDIPAVALPGDAGTLRVIAGAYEGRRGPARTFSPVGVWDLRLKAGRRVALQVPDGHSATVVVLRGSVKVNDAEAVGDSQLVLLDRHGEGLTLEAGTDAKVLVLSGQPLDEPVAWYGPFVMNTQAELAEAIDDFDSGRFGAIVQ